MRLGFALAHFLLFRLRYATMEDAGRAWTVQSLLLQLSAGASSAHHVQTKRRCVKR